VSFFVPQGNSEEVLEYKASMWKNLMIDQFILVRDLNGCSFTDVNGMTKSERDYMLHLLAETKKAREELYKNKQKK
jgi:hypothetical protein